MSTIKLFFSVATAAGAALLPAGMADAARYAVALVVDHLNARRFAG